jgi:hypothetical protein
MKAPSNSPLEQLENKIHVALHRHTKSIIEIGQLLIQSHDLIQYGEWTSWLKKNFDLSHRTATRYIAAARYAELRLATVANLNLENLAPGVLYDLAAGSYSDEQEAAILAATREGHVSSESAYAISSAINREPAKDDDAATDDQEYGGELTPAEDPAEDPEIEAILDGPPPEVPPTAPNPPPTDFALRDFDEAITALKRLMTKLSTEFASTIHSAEDLEHIEDFIRTVRKALG